MQPLAQLSALDRLHLHDTGLSKLEPLAGFSSLASLSLTDNPSLTSLAGLESLVTITDSLTITDNPALPDLLPLGQLSSVGGDLTLHGNLALSSLAGLEQLTTVGGSLELGDCWVFSDEFGLSMAEPVGTPAITSLAGLDSLEHVNGLSIVGNPYLVSLAGAPNLLTVGQRGVGIHDNPTLPFALAQAFVDQLAIAGELRLCEDDDVECDWCTAALGPQ